MNKNTILGSIAVVLLAAVAVYALKIMPEKANTLQIDQTEQVSTTTNTNTTPEPESVTESPTVGMANPASVFCIENGGKLVPKATDAGESADCVFPSGESCEEWSLFLGECSIEGVSKTATYTSGTTTLTATFRIASGTVEIDALDLGVGDEELNSAVSGSGSRYLSADGKIEFWEHQGEATLTVDSKEIFKGKKSN